MPSRPTTGPADPAANHTGVIRDNVVALRSVRLPGVVRDHDTAWMVDAACRGVAEDLWFPERGDTKSAQSEIRQAKAVCANCTVRYECLDYAIANHEVFGIWGGLTEKERRDAKRRGA